MKKITLSILYFSFALGAEAQNLPIDFEVGGTGINWTWTTFEDASNPPLEFVDNPDPSGINSSLFVAKFTALQLGKPWAGFESQHGAGIGSFSFDATNCVFRIMVYKTVISDVGLKFASSSNAAQPELKKPNTLINQWEEMEFNVCGLIGVYPQVVDQIIIFPDFNLSNRTQDNIIYVDNIGNNGSVSGLEHLAGQSSFAVFPNPSQHTISIAGILPSEALQSLQIINHLGQVVLCENKNFSQLDVHLLNQGHYFLRIETSERIEVLEFNITAQGE
jgi:hypothetical protein